MARPWKRLGLAALAAALLCPAPAALAQPAFVTAPVTAPMVLAAMDICTRQIRAGAFDADALTRAGWVLAIRAEGNPVIRGYRHPDNMILLNTFDHAGEADTCSVMAPVGRGLSLEEMRAAIEAQTHARPDGATGAMAWTVDGMSLELKPMGAAGVVVEIRPSGSGGHSGARS